MSAAKPIDARQHVWWHRIRRFGPWLFVLGGGALLSPLVTCLLFAGVVAFYRYPLSTFLTTGTFMWLVTAPIYAAVWFWTWKHMEERYRATLAVHCPQCGYSLRGMTDVSRCPECGERQTG